MLKNYKINVRKKIWMKNLSKQPERLLNDF